MLPGVDGRLKRDARPFEYLNERELKILLISLRGQADPKDPGMQLNDFHEIDRKRMILDVESEQEIRQAEKKRQEREILDAFQDQNR